MLSSRPSELALTMWGSHTGVAAGWEYVWVRHAERWGAPMGQLGLRR